MGSTKDGVKASRRREYSDVKDGDSVKSAGGLHRKKHAETKASDGAKVDSMKEHSELARQSVQPGDGGQKKRHAEAKAGDGVKADSPQEHSATATQNVQAGDGAKADDPQERSAAASQGVQAGGRADEVNHGAQPGAADEHSDVAMRSSHVGAPKVGPETTSQSGQAVDVKANDGVRRSNTKASNGARSAVVSSIPEVPVTVQRKPFVQPDDKVRLPQAGTARANIAASVERPEGTTQGGWAERHQNQTVLQQHVDFFDQDHDGVIWPIDTFRGFYALGYGILFSLFAAIVINGAFSYPTLSGYLPDPLFRIYMRNIHKDKHGSDSGTYDNEGRFVPQKFEDIFSKYAAGRDYVTVRDVLKFLRGQRLVADPFGWFGAFFEWLATYLLLWPSNGRMAKEDIRGVYDGSIFYTIAARRQQAKNRR